MRDAGERKPARAHIPPPHGHLGAATPVCGRPVSRRRQLLQSCTKDSPCPPPSRPPPAGGAEAGGGPADSEVEEREAEAGTPADTAADVEVADTAADVGGASAEVTGADA